MNEQPQDFELLRRFLRQGDQPAFATVVRRHVDLVYATALRGRRMPGRLRRSRKTFLPRWRARRGSLGRATHCRPGFTGNAVADHQTSVKSAFWSGDDRNLKPRFFAQVKPQLLT